MLQTPTERRTLEGTVGSSIYLPCDFFLLVLAVSANSRSRRIVSDRERFVILLLGPAFN